ncbi:MAG: hemolysin family protein [Sporichthyaceae bacterium]
MWVLTLLVGLLVVLAITAATGYFVAQEFSYMAVDRSRLKARSAAGDLAATRALAVTQRTSFMLSGAQLGITVTALLVGFVAEPLIGSALGDALGGVGISTGVGVAIGTAAALLFSTFVQMIFGELFPKNLAIARPEPVALRLAASTTLYLTLFGWLIRVFDQASNLLLRAIRIEPVHDVEHAATARDLEHIVEDSRDSGDLPAELSVLLDRILDFPAQNAEHAMIPRSRVDTVRASDSLDSVRERMGAGHSRYPVLDDGEDDAIVGVVHLQDVLAAGDGQASAGSLMRAPALVPTSMALPDVLRLLTATRNQLACVLDEYGGFAGVLTTEDLAEELVGEITDEHDPDAPEPALEEPGAWIIPGEVHLDEVERTIDRELPRDGYQTLSGLLIAEHGALPEIGTVVDVELPQDLSHLDEEAEITGEFVRLEVLELERHVPSLVRLTFAETQADAGDSADPADPVDASVPLSGAVRR